MLFSSRRKHCFCLANKRSLTPKQVSPIQEEVTCRLLKIWTGAGNKYRCKLKITFKKNVLNILSMHFFSLVVEGAGLFLSEWSPQKHISFNKISKNRHSLHSLQKNSYPKKLFHFCKQLVKNYHYGNGTIHLGV